MQHLAWENRTYNSQAAMQTSLEKMRRLLRLSLLFGVRLWHARLILGTPDASGTMLEKEAGAKPAACQHLSDKPAEFGASWRKVVNNLCECCQICYLVLAV